MKILVLHPYPADVAASQRFRFEQYLTILTEEQIDFDRQSFLDLGAWEVLYQSGFFWAKVWGILFGFSRRLIMLFRVSKFDFVLVHREVTPIGPPIFEWIVSRIFRKKIIYDFDDSIWLSNTSEENRIVSKFKWHSKVATICRLSYRVSAGNEYLANYARMYNPRVQINPTTIDTELFHNPELIKRDPILNEKDPIIVGWTGTHSTLPYLLPLIPVIRNLQKTRNFAFMIISNQEPKFALDRLIYRPWKKETEIKDLSKITIGVMPLPDNPWTQGKCGFKLLQFMAMETPVVASPIGVNQRILTHGKEGFLCSTLEDWHKHLELLLEDVPRRKEMGFYGRQKVKQYYSVESNRDNFLSLFT